MGGDGARWIEVSVEADQESVDDLVRLFSLHCRGGAVVETSPPGPDGGARGRAIVKGFLPTWEEETLRKLEIALLLLGKISSISEPRIKLLEPEDWAESWKAFFPPQHIGEHTVIVPTWHTYIPREGEVVIRLDPGMAFGTGLHASTRLCLIAIEQLLRPGMHVLDVGTGSGILAISAALHGAALVRALDIDPDAVRTARENVVLNNVEDIVQVDGGTLRVEEGSLPPAEYDLVLVNILAEVIVGMAQALYSVLLPSGRLIASGIIAEKGEWVQRELEGVGLRVLRCFCEGDWVALVAGKE
ncbi:MAG: 50S ribosomal protein L11 methyltransferase [Anaerolineae bacterium]|nr:50S ribosomal protein L11 methyltransferase [Anaerolineae bacterium]